MGKVNPIGAVQAIFVSMTPHELAVRHYYDRNTPLFKRWENLEGPLPVHREIWAPGVQTKLAALNWIHHAIAEEFDNHDQAIDLGCGNGAALRFLAARNPSAKPLIGLTLSPYQAAQAAAHLGSRAEIRIGSYVDPVMFQRPAGTTLFYAIESFAHAESARAFIANLTTNAKPGDSFCLGDDLLRHSPASRHEAALLRAFSRGWKVPDLQSHQDLIESFSRQGWQLRQDADWRTWLKPPGFWHRLGSLAALGFPDNPPWIANLKGGAALVLGHRCGLFHYRFMSWTKL